MTQTIPEHVLKEYAPQVTTVPRLDRQGEPCQHCQTEGATVQAQFYGTTIGDLYAQAHEEVGDSCYACLPKALMSAGINPCEPVQIEVGPPGRFVSMVHPQYVAGTGLAHYLIGAGEGRNADYWQHAAEIAAERAESRDDDSSYHLAKGLADTLGEYRQDQD